MAPKKRSGSRTTSVRGSKRSGRNGRAKSRGTKTSQRTSGSRPPSGPSAGAPVDALRTLAALAKALRVRWYLFGAQAAVLWGRARTTADVDVTMEVDPDRAEELLRSARAFGLHAREANTVELARSTRVVPLITAGGFPVDLVLAGTGLEAQFLDRARPVRVGAVEVPVISPEDLVITKLIAGRPRDLEDIEGVLAERGDDIDVGYVDAMLREIESALEMEGLKSAWEQLLWPTRIRR